MKTPILALVRASILAFSLLGGATHAAEETGMPASVAAALRTAGIPRSSVGLMVQEVGERTPALSINADTPFNPASVMKLLTTYAALEILGPAFTWSTDIYMSGALEQGILRGNLYIKGSGDPRLSIERLWLLMRELRTKGVRDIAGDIILDSSAFQTGPHDPGAFDNEPFKPYNVGPSALLLNYKAIGVRLLPRSDGKAPELMAEPTLAGVSLVNRINTVAGACGDWRDGIKAELESGAGEAKLVLSGAYPLTCGEKVWHVAPLAHAEFSGALLRALWQDIGGSLRGRVSEGRVPANARLLAHGESPPLPDIIREINKYSNNVMARQLYFTLGLKSEGLGTPESARRAIDQWAREKSLPLPGLALENGAGLSRQERLTASGLTNLLQAAWRSPVMPELMSSLPLAGVDGTMKKRLNGNGVAGQAHIKTGYLADVRALAGYVLDQEGRRWIVVAIINHPQSRAGKPAMDALLAWVHSGRKP